MENLQQCSRTQVIHSIANGGRELCENDQENLFNKGDLWNDDEITILGVMVNCTIYTLWYGHGLPLAGESNIQICYAKLRNLNGLKGNKV